MYLNIDCLLWPVLLNLSDRVYSNCGVSARLIATFADIFSNNLLCYKLCCIVWRSITPSEVNRLVKEKTKCCTMLICSVWIINTRKLFRLFLNLLFQIHCLSVVCFHCLQLRLLSHQTSSVQHQLSAWMMQVIVSTFKQLFIYIFCILLVDRNLLKSSNTWLNFKFFPSWTSGSVWTAFTLFGLERDLLCTGVNHASIVCCQR